MACMDDSSWNEWFPSQCSSTHGKQSREYNGDLSDGCVGVEWRNCQPVIFDAQYTEYPCNIPINFDTVCPSACKMYEPPWAKEIRAGVAGYCAPFYDPQRKVDCTSCGTMKLLSGPINSVSSAPIPNPSIDNPTDSISKDIDWKQNVTDKVSELSDDTKKLLNKLLNDIMG